MTAFADLAAMRRRAVDGLRENGMETGFRQLLADLYPDNAHFIYELLQNAEDAGAREVIFDLRQDGLRVEHDGPRMFDLKDIASITSIGQSTKADDAVAIGKFGVGFKAVFAYTQRPVIHSGDHSFAIVDLFVPTPVDPERQPRRTRFWFPFDRPDKPAQLACEQVERSLREISQSTLLFLHHIAMISCSFPDGDERLLERKDVIGSPKVISIESVHGGEDPSYWYRVTGDAHIDGRAHQVAAAFALATNDSAERTIQPVEGQVFIYFPAVSEASGLKFHIHAPFASTVARDSVRDDDDNDALVAGIAEVVASELPLMRKAGLMTDGLMEALPNNTDALKPRYKSIRDAVLHAFETQPITPVAGGRIFAESRLLVRSVSQVRAALDPADVLTLRTITEGQSEATGWLQERGRGRAQDLLDSIQAIDFGRSELADVLERVRGIQEETDLYADEPEEYVDEPDRLDLATWSTWIEGLSDEKLRGFYVALGRLAAEGVINPYGLDDSRRWLWSDSLPEALAGVRLVRVRRGGGVAHVLGRHAHLPPTAGVRSDGLVLDSLAYFGDGETKAAEHEANALRQFYAHADVRAWDAAAQLSARFSSYEPGTGLDLAGHVEDLKTLASLLQDGVVQSSDYAHRAILLGSTGTGELSWASPRELCLDRPYLTTGLSTLPGATTLAPEYVSYDGLDVVVLAKSLGVRSGVEITVASPKRGNSEFSWSWYHNERDTVVSRDWVVPAFKDIVATENEHLLRTLWAAVASAPADRAEAHYRANRAAAWHFMRSQLAHQLTGTPWVLDRFGNLNLPQDVDPSDLDPALLEVLPDLEPTGALEATLLGKIGFGEKAARDADQAQLAEQQRVKTEEAAQLLGFQDADEAQRFKAARETDPAAYVRFLEAVESQRLAPPEGASGAPGRRAERAVEGAAASQDRTHEKRTRTVRIQEPGHLSSARNYLRQMYTNDQEVMMCQVCQGPMPFKVGNDFYFEAVQFVKDAKKDLQQNRLALCPTCAAKYRHALQTSLDDLRDDLLTQTVDTRPSVEVAVTLAGEDHALRFVGKHAIDLQAALDATEGQPVADDLDDLGADMS